MLNPSSTASLTVIADFRLEQNQFWCESSTYWWIGRFSWCFCSRHLVISLPDAPCHKKGLIREPDPHPAGGRSEKGKQINSRWEKGVSQTTKSNDKSSQDKKDLIKTQKHYRRLRKKPKQSFSEVLVSELTLMEEKLNPDQMDLIQERLGFHAIHEEWRRKAGRILWPFHCIKDLWKERNLFFYRI